MRRHWICLLLAVTLLPCAAFAQAPAVDMDAGCIRYESPASLSITSTLPLKDGTLLITVSGGDALPKGPVTPVEDEASAPYPEVARQVTLLRISGDGRVLWEQSFGEADGSVGLELLCEAADGTVLALADHTVRQEMQYQQLRRFSIADGAMTWSGDKLMAVENTNEYVHPVGDGYLWITIHDSGASTEPRYYALHSADGTPRWQVDQRQTVPVLEQALATPHGTLLIGKGWNGDDYEACAALVDDTGKVLWRKDYAELGPSFFCHGAVSPGGQLVTLALTGPMGTTSETRQYTMASIDPGNGALRVCAAWHAKDVRQPQIASAGDGWLIAGTHDQEKHPALRFIKTDTNGNTMKTWDEPFDAEVVFSPSLFAWNHALWAEVEMETKDTQAAWLQRIAP